MTTYEAQMSFLEPWPSTKTESPYVRGMAEDGYLSQNFQNVEHTVEITDARLNKENFKLDTHGFAWYKDTNLSAPVLEAIRSKDKDSVIDAYYPLVEDLVKRATGATRTIVFDHTYRKRNPELDMKENPNGKEQPATVVSLIVALQTV